MRSFENSLGEFVARRVRVVAISVDSPEITRELCREQGYTFTFLSDPNADAIRRYDLLHEGGGPDGRDIARPAEFLIDPAGMVRWINLTDSVTRRARPAQVLEIVDALGLATDPSR